jgi:hypothetical protein
MSGKLSKACINCIHLRLDSLNPAGSCCSDGRWDGLFDDMDKEELKVFITKEISCIGFFPVKQYEEIKMNNIPEGYREDAKGRLVPESQIKEIDKLRDEAVNKIISRWEAEQAKLIAFKNWVMSEIAGFVDLSAAEYDVEFGGKKGNITLISFDGRFKIQVAIAERIAFDEQLQIAKELIDKCINRWVEGSRDEIKTIINDAFQVDKEGKLSVTRILSLKRLNISDSDWVRAMDAINNSLHVVDSKSYVRAYKRGNDGKFQALKLDFAAL